MQSNRQAKTCFSRATVGGGLKASLTPERSFAPAGTSLSRQTKTEEWEEGELSAFDVLTKDAFAVCYLHARSFLTSIDKNDFLKERNEC